MDEERVTVVVGFTLAGHCVQEVKMTRKQFEALDAMRPWDLREELEGFIDWTDVVAEVGGCDDFYVLEDHHQ